MKSGGAGSCFLEPAAPAGLLWLPSVAPVRHGLGWPTGTLNVRDHHEAWDGDGGKPHAYVYSGFHHPNVTASVDVVSHDDGQLTADIKLVTDDVRYYDERTRDNSMTGQCVLSRQPRDEMWGP